MDINKICKTMDLGFRKDKAICLSQKIFHTFQSTQSSQKKEGKQSIMVGHVEGVNFILEDVDSNLITFVLKKCGLRQ